jgi:endonuclease-3
MKMNKIFDYLDELFPNPKCELEFNNEFELLVATMLSAQTTDKKVNVVMKELFKKYDYKSLRNANIKDIESILKTLGMSNKKAKYLIDIANKYNGNILNDRNKLMEYSGIGRKVANIVLLELYNEPYIPVDTHVTRVSKRLGLVKPNDNVFIIENKLYKLIPKERIRRTHYQLVLFGRYHCKSINPNCNICKLKDICKKESLL